VTSDTPSILAAFPIETKLSIARLYYGEAFVSTLNYYHIEQ